MLAIGTAGILVAGPVIIGFIPIMVVGALIFLLGIDLLREALYDTWGKLQQLEYLTVGPFSHIFRHFKLTAL
jgi:SulP family sulfate permease